MRIRQVQGWCAMWGLCVALALAAAPGSAAGAVDRGSVASDGKPAAGTAAAGLTAAQVVDRNVAARGGLQAWREVSALSFSGNMEAGTGTNIRRSLAAAEGGSRRSARMAMAQGAKADAKGEGARQVLLPFVMDMQRPNLSRLEIEFAGKTAVQVYDGAHGWKVRPFLNRSEVEPFTDAELKAEAGKHALDGPLVDYAAKGTRVALDAVEPVEGRDAYRLKLTLKDGREQYVWIDVHSFLDVKVQGMPRRMDGKLRDVWIYQRDFRPVQGVMVPFVLETVVDGFHETHKLFIDKVVVNPRLERDRFAKPGA